MIEESIVIAAMTGKIIDIALKGKDDNGYDYLIIKFTDDTGYQVIEHSETGEIKQYWI